MFVGPDREDVITWAVDAWNDLSKATIISGFTKAKVLFDLPRPRDDADERRAAFDESLDAVVAAMVDLKLVSSDDVVSGAVDLFNVECNDGQEPVQWQPVEN